MTRRAAVIVVALVVAALVGVALMAVPSSPVHDEVTLGLDLQGGLEVTLQAIPPKERKLTKSDLDRSVGIMRDRVDKLGVAEPEIRKQGNDQIVIQLPGIKDPAAAAQVIGKTAQLELYDLEPSLTGPSVDTQGNPVPIPRLYDLLARVQAQAAAGSPDTYYLFDKQKRLAVGPVPTRKAALRKLDAKVPKGYKLFGVPEKTVVVTCGKNAVVCPNASADRTYFYLFKYDPPKVPQMTGADLKLSGTRADFDTSPGSAGAPVVLMDFTDAGSKKFKEITRQEWLRGRIRQAPQHFAIVLDREIRTFPQIDYTDSSLSGGIGGGGARITGLDSIREAKDIAIVLQTGALPVKFVTLDQTEISATLGKDSLREAKVAIIAGLVAIALFLLFIYRFLGLIAVAGLGVYAAFLYAAILLLNVTLTLPGIAGLVLTLGVAADANVVIFERVKEEARAGRSVRAAIAQGYTKGFHTIVDANVVTAITALVLFAVATASVRGFALMLLIGTAISMLTAVLATRAFLALLGGFAWIENPKLMGASGRGIPAWLKIDYIGRRRLWFAFSGVIVAVSILALGVRGLNLGIDFKGGTQISFKTPQPIALEDVRSTAAEVGQAKAVIQGRGTPTGDKYGSFQIRTESLAPAESARLQDALQEKVKATAFGTKNVSESFGRQIASSAIIAILVSLLLIVAYISLRFQWKFALPVLIALFHDVLITVGIYALVGREVTTSTVAAVLTVLGYSIYDTIIIFDRMRENIPLMRRASFRVIGNVSLWETIPRSLATTFITLLPIASPFLFGGDTLKDFAFALLVGIGSGAYSSIFVAAPLLAVFKERESEYARRRDDEAALAGVQSVGGVLGEPQVGESEAEPKLVGAAPTPKAAPTPPPPAPAQASSKRERRRQRRSSRPHGRAR